MEKVYIVVLNKIDYEGGWTVNVAACSTKEKAQKVMREYVAKYPHGLPEFDSDLNNDTWTPRFSDMDAAWRESEMGWSNNTDDHIWFEEMEVI